MTDHLRLGWYGWAVGFSVFVATTAISYCVVRLIRLWAERHNVLDIPTARSSHETPTPRGGGLAIVALILPTIVTVAFIDPASRRMPLLVFGGILAIIAAVSWIDDLRSLSM